MRLHFEVLFRKLHIWPVVVVIAIALALSSVQVFAAGRGPVRRIRRSLPQRRRLAMLEQGSSFLRAGRGFKTGALHVCPVIMRGMRSSAP